MNSLADWIYRESRRRAHDLEGDIVRRLKLEAERQAGKPESVVKARLELALSRMHVAITASRRDFVPLAAYAPWPQAMWDEARAAWEADERPGYAWLIREMSLPVTSSAVRKRAIKEAWAKCQPM